jgi:peptidoglycan/LPS O-acetylase OafA/YrhL
MTKRIPALDGLRGLAAMAVVWAHTHEGSQIGGAAVSVFFVLSGFLIGGILLNGIDLPTFYLRRTLRIWPLYFAVVALIVATEHRPLHEPQWMLWTFLGNTAVDLPSYTGRTSVRVLWSLAVEEHFYLLFPWLLRSMRQKEIPSGLVAMAIGSVLVRVVIVHATGMWRTGYHESLGRFDGLSLGGLAAWVVRERPQWCGSLVTSAALFLCGGMLMRHDAGFQDTSLYGVLVLQEWDTIAAVALILALVTHRETQAARVLSWAPVRWLGTVSFGIYLLHPLAAEALTHMHVRAGFWLLAPVTVGVASLSWLLYEKPLQTLGRREDSPFMAAASSSA